MQKYEDLLSNLYSKLPEKTSTGERFEMPVVEVFVEGSKTVLRNFDFVCSKLRRKPAEVAKYLSKELAAPGVIDGQRLLVSSKLNARIVNDKIKNYVEGYVLCRECGKPDSHIVEQGDFSILVCEACGAKRPVR